MKTETIAAIKECDIRIEVIRQAINSQKCISCSLYICKEIELLTNSLIHLCNLIQSIHPYEEVELRSRANNFTGKQRINPYDFGAVIAIIGILKKYYLSSGAAKKIFISHSSKDEKIIISFITHVLRLGCGLQPDDIIYTSLESMGGKTGEDIRNYLKVYLKNCDYVFFMISDNYRKSSICLNEMGAAWVLDKKVKPLLFPKMNFTDLGWLYEISKGAILNNESALDDLRDELLTEYHLIKSIKTSDWTVQKKYFLSVLNEN